MNRKRKNRIILFILLFIVVSGSASILFFHLYDKENMVLGNHINSFYYSRGIGKEAYENLEEALDAVDVNYDGKMLLFSVDTENVAKAFIQSENRIIGCEFLIKDNKYYYVGKRELVFQGENVSKEYDWKTEFLSDLSCSTRKSYKRIIRLGENYKVHPAWGVSDHEQVRELTVDGQAVDEVIAFSQDGKNYYLWMIHDLQTEKNAADIEVRGGES